MSTRERALRGGFMGKRKPRHNGQFAFDFDLAPPCRARGSLAGLESLISGAVSTILHGDERPREVIAAEMSVLLGEEVSRSMLDAYASPARVGHKVPMSRFEALVLTCDRHDQFDLCVRPIGAAVLKGKEVKTARIGHIDRQIAQLKAERKAIENDAPLIGEIK